MANGKMGNPNVGPAAAATNPQTPQNPQQRQVPNPNIPGPMRQAASKGFTDLGFALIGSAFAEEFNDPELAKPMQRMGENIANTLQDRWYKQEYENFVAQHGQKFQQAAMQLQQHVSQKMNQLNRGIYVDEETGTTQSLDPDSPKGVDVLTRLAQNLHRDTSNKFIALNNNYMQAAAKYRGNPYIESEIANMLTTQTNIIGANFAPSPALESEKQRADVRLTREQAGQASRSPATSGQDKHSNATVRGIIMEMGPQSAADFFLNNPKGKNFANSYVIAERNRAIAKLIQEDEMNAGTSRYRGYEANPDAARQEVLKYDDDIQAKAIGRMISEHAPEVAPNFLKSKVGQKYAPLEPEPQKPVKLDRLEQKKFLNDMESRAKEYLGEIVDSGEFTTYEAAVDEVLGNALEFARDRFGGGLSEKLAAEIRSRLANAFKNPREVAKEIPALREVMGELRKTIRSGRGGPTGMETGKLKGLLKVNPK